ncbi:MAG: hypothetical protein KJZ84_20225, partial [Bryobacteraceae bacterium]|nr:hypothetical protein [Bryobacteraceae bacterium]
MLLLTGDAPYALQHCFISALAEQLQDEDSCHAPLERWIEESLNTILTDLVRNEHGLDDQLREFFNQRHRRDFLPCPAGSGRGAG